MIGARFQRSARKRVGRVDPLVDQRPFDFVKGGAGSELFHILVCGIRQQATERIPGILAPAFEVERALACVDGARALTRLRQHLSETTPRKFHLWLHLG